MLSSGKRRVDSACMPDGNCEVRLSFQEWPILLKSGRQKSSSSIHMSPDVANVCPRNMRSKPTPMELSGIKRNSNGTQAAIGNRKEEKRHRETNRKSTHTHTCKQHTHTPTRTQTHNQEKTRKRNSTSKNYYDAAEQAGEVRYGQRSRVASASSSALERRCFSS